MRGTLLLLLCGAVAIVGVSRGVGRGVDDVTTGGVAPRPTVERLTLQSSGETDTCTIEKSRAAGPVTHVVVAPECDRLLPGLSKATSWIEQADGTVALSADGSAPAAVFAEADGVAYESIEPRTPLLSLLAGN